MDSQKQLKLDVISKLSRLKINTKQAMQVLQKSESQIYRYLKEYRARGALFVQHKNSNKIPRNKTSAKVEDEIIKLCKKKYNKFNRSHAREEIATNEGINIPKDTFNRICNRNSLLNKKVKKRKPKNRFRRDRMAQRGIMLQLDGSPHRWFGRRKTCLVAIIDDATSDILYGEFSPTETTFACMNVVKHVLKQFGTFQILYTDRAGIFGKDSVNHFDAVKREGFSSLKECLLKFNIQTIYAYSPEAKGRIERAFNTLQDRLVAEMSLHNIKTIEQANRYLNNVYLKKHRERFVVNAKDKKSAFIPILNTVNLDELFYMKETRKVRKDHSFSYKGHIIDIEPDGNNHSEKEIEIRSYPDGKVRYFIDDKEIRLKEAKMMII